MSTQTDAAKAIRTLAIRACEDGSPMRLEAMAMADDLDRQAAIDDKRYIESMQLQDIGRCAAASLVEMVAALECDYDRLEELRAMRDDEQPNDHAMSLEDADELKELEEAAGECTSREEAEQRIHDDPLSIELSGKWTIGETPTADKAIILLGTGGPAVRIVCELSDGEPSRAWIEAQDWFKPWTQYIGGDSDTLLTYCRCFYFGEG